MALSARLKAAAEFIRPGASVCDVGTDHAFLPCHLAKNGFLKIYACDINPKPLELAGRYIEERGLADKITLIKSDGLENVPQCDDVVIAGMGGETIAGIAERIPFKNPNLRLILQPMTKADVLRTRLGAAGYRIIAEKNVSDGGKNYVVIYAKYCEEKIMTVRDIYNFLDGISPFKNQESDDNSGLIIGDMDRPVKKITVCLDITAEVAGNTDADLIIAHHPIIYRPIKKISEHDAVYRLIKNGAAAIGFHTNHDIADGGVTDLMLSRLGLPESKITIGDGFGRITEIESAVTAEELAGMCKNAFNCAVVKYVGGGKPIKKIGLCSGGGSFLTDAAYGAGCDAYICGDIRWDRFVFAANMGMTLIDAGHFHTEDIFCGELVKKLLEKFPEILTEKSKYSKDLCNYVT